MVTAAKRAVRILTAALPLRTKRGLLAAERSRGRADVVVPIGALEAHVPAESHRVDYFTLYGAIVDGHFPCDVRDAAVLDVGAHKGYFALRSFAAGAVRVDSYEPASQNFGCLSRSAERVESWHVHRCAVGAEAGSIELHLAPGSWGHSVHVPVGGESVGTETVDMVSLSDALAAVSCTGAPVVVKINVEGAAGEMVLGTEPADWAPVRLLWTDVEPNDPVGVPRLVQHLADCGLRHERTEGHRNLFVRPGIS
jgi:FkbM family methyltransferase